MLPQGAQKYFGEDGDGIHMMFNFFVNQHLFYALASGDIGPLAEALKATRKRSRRPRNGRSSCAITTSSISAG